MHYLGIDWATDKHDICLLASDGRTLSEFQIPHDLAGFHRLRDLLQTLTDVRINIERSDGLLVDWLVQEGYGSSRKAMTCTSPHHISSPTGVRHV